MPYRRLPNTDAARSKALQKAYDKAKVLPPFKLAFSQQTYQRIQSFLPSFQNAIHQAHNAFTIQTSKSNEYNLALKKAKMYISHFIQVFNLAVQRADIPEEQRALLGLPDGVNKVPKMQSESEVMKWGEKLIHGESLRRTKGFSPMTNPTIAVVKVRYEQFLESLKYQKTLQKNYQRALENLNNLRDDADNIILSIWNEVEEHFKDLPADERRQTAEEYGLVYVYRKSELKNNS